MISFVIYEKDEELRALYVKVIKKFLYSTVDHYKIYEFDKYNIEAREEIERIAGAKIYILSLETPKDIIGDLATTIRGEGDFISPIILITNGDKRDYVDHLNNILYTSFIKVDESFVSNLLVGLKNAYRIVTKYSVYTFSSYDEIFRIPYDDIQYIVKNLHDDSVTIYTRDDSYLNFISLKGVEELLSNDPRFFKTHRSCILNLYNISSYDKKSNTVVFSNGMSTSLVSKYRRAKLSQILRDFDNEVVCGK